MTKVHRKTLKPVPCKRLGDTVRLSEEATNVSCVCGQDVHVAWWWPWAIVAGSLVARVALVTSSDSWWTLHPDEVYQSIEGLLTILKNCLTTTTTTTTTATTTVAAATQQQTKSNCIA